MKEKIFDLIEPSEKSHSVYDYFMMAVIFISLVPLAFKSSNAIFEIINLITTSIFIVDYLARWMISGIKLKRGSLSFLLYPFTPMAVIDLLSILPFFCALSNGFRILKIFRLFKFLRVFRTLKILRYSRSIQIIISVIRKQATPLLAVGTLAIGYILISALIIFNVEPDTFSNFFDAVYWATVSLTTVGYGDIYPVSDFGRIITMVSSFVGIAIVALPSGIITAGYMDEVKSGNDEHN